MNLQRVTGPGFRYTCYGCNKPSQYEPNSPVILRSVCWADLDGPAFKAYYCSECANKLELEGKVKLS